MRVFDVIGVCILEFVIIFGFFDFVISFEGRFIGICSNNSEFLNFVVILFYM